MSIGSGALPRLRLEIRSNWYVSNQFELMEGGLQQVNWEVNALLGETCYVDSNKGIPCRQGNLPLYGVAVESAEDISTTIKFASQRNLRLVIKNTGHDFLGRSTAKGSLSIWTHRMRSISFSDDFKQQGCSKWFGSAVTIGAGVQLSELYSAVAQHNLSVVTGMAHSVGAAGGYIQGGGHSPMANLFGMSTDNVLEYKVITAKVLPMICN
jgi:FAD/FMN-containing dehydrogenase